MARHSVKNNSKRNKNNHKLLIVIIVFILVLSTISTLYFIFNRKSDNEPENQINNLFNALKRNKIQDVNEYVNYDDIIASLDESILDKDNKRKESNLERELFKDLEWKINSIETLDNQVIATVSVTNKDFKNIVTKWLKEIINQDSESNNISEDLMLKKLEEILAIEENKRTSNNLIIFDKIEDEWKIQANDNLIYLIFPGLDTINAVLN